MKPYYQDDWAALYHVDCEEFLPTLPDESIELVFTDPPYQKKYEWLYGVLGAESQRLLVDTGNLVTLCGHYQVLDVGREIERCGLRFWWMCGLLQTDRTRMAGKWINIWWKPILWFVKRARRLDNTSMLPNDIVKGIKEKGQHPWQQPVNLAVDWIKGTTLPGEVVLDPMAGSGTTLVAAKLMDRQSIGIEIEEEACEISAGRLEAAEAGSLCQ